MDRDKNIYYAYWLGFLTITIWIPSIIMLITYAFIINKLRKSIKSFPYLSVQSRLARSRKKVIQMLIILIITELVCWAPWQFQTVVDFIDSSNTTEKLIEVSLLAKILSPFRIVSFFDRIMLIGNWISNQLFMTWSISSCLLTVPWIHWFTDMETTIWEKLSKSHFHSYSKAK